MCPTMVLLCLIYNIRYILVRQDNGREGVLMHARKSASEASVRQDDGKEEGRGS